MSIIADRLLMDCMKRLGRILEGIMNWQPIETAPKGGGAELTTDPNWVEPPEVLLWWSGIAVVAAWDWYYAEGGRGEHASGLAWVEPLTGELLANYLNGAPSKWVGITGPKEPKEANL